mmetsp:Transcript_106705/g.306959  ORF Transcript_106705/g.306959 Transcript_106705/m.306959 type:complete len:190 (+) Transcript_106705:28-597(+)
MSGGMARPPDTIIYVDINGVLNVGIRDDGASPLLLDSENLSMARRARDLRLLSPQARDYIDRVTSVADRRVGSGEGATYSDYACAGGKQVVDALLARLAQIIRAADDPFVVLTSNWRKPKHKEKMRRLEDAISKHMGSPFVFDGATDVADDSNAADRLLCIGEHLRTLLSHALPVVPKRKGSTVAPASQ